MCYMSGTDSVGVRELRQNLSVYLRRVEDGETLRVTDRGRPVALLAPLLDRQTLRDRMIAAGDLIPARRGLGGVPPAPDVEVDIPLSQALDEVREDRA